MFSLDVDGVQGPSSEPAGELSRAATVAEALRREIVEGVLAPGQRIKQDAVAQRLEVSRLPVREALRQLQSEGLVQLERDVGARVAPLEISNLLEISLVREAVEPPLIAEATRRIDEAQLDVARELNARAEEYAEAGEDRNYVNLDPQFHDAIFVAAAMPHVHEIVKGHRNAASRYRHAYSHLPRHLDASVVEHRMILEAVARRAPADAAELHRIHIRRTRVTLSEHPEFFVEGNDDG